MKNFDGFGLHPALMSSLERMKYTQPTPIQAEAIPLALNGRDIMGSAQTGTGKTAAFAIPLVEGLLRSEESGSAIVLTPTRELGKQIMDIMRQLLGPNSNIKTAFLIGGESMGKQLGQLRMQPRLIVGTPGRINDHLKRGTLKLNDTRFLVLDETDRMLDMGFSVQIDRIVKHIPDERQTLMFSATLPDNIVQMSRQYLNNPERIAVGSTINPIENIKQEIIRVSDEEKYGELVVQLHDRTGSVIMFVKTKRATEKLAKKLSGEGFEAEAINGDLRQNRRDRVIKDFRNKKFRILVATDVVARGLDIPHIEHVINYDLPQVPEDYIHRIGRTARAGADGASLCLIAPKDGRKWHAIEMLMDPSKKSEGGPSPKKHRRNFKGKSSRHNNNKFVRSAEGKNWKSSEGRPNRKPKRDFSENSDHAPSEKKFSEKAQSKPWKATNDRPNHKPKKKFTENSGNKSWKKPAEKSGNAPAKKFVQSSHKSAGDKPGDRPMKRAGSKPNRHSNGGDNGGQKRSAHPGARGHNGASHKGRPASSGSRNNTKRAA